MSHRLVVLKHDFAIVKLSLVYDSHDHWI